MEMTAAARHHALSLAPVTSYVQDRVWKDRLEAKLDETGQRAIVFKDAGGWAQPEARNTQEYPLLRCEFWADHQRNEDGTIATYDGLTSAKAVYRAWDRLVHGIRDQRWGATTDRDGLFVVGCQRWGEPIPAQGADLGTALRGSAESDDFEAACVVVHYALQIIH